MGGELNLRMPLSVGYSGGGEMKELEKGENKMQL